MDRCCRGTMKGGAQYPELLRGPGTLPRLLVAIPTRGGPQDDFLYRGPDFLSWALYVRVGFKPQ